jgi:hypothetical protein
MVSLIEYMNEEKAISRIKILYVGIIGMFAGACLLFIFVLAGIL